MFKRLFPFALVLLVVPVLLIGVSAASVSDPAPVIVSYPDSEYVENIDFTGYRSFAPFDLAVLESLVFEESGVSYLNVLFDSQVFMLPISYLFELPGLSVSVADNGFYFLSSSPFDASFVAFGGRDSFSSGILTCNFTMFSIDDGADSYLADVPSLYGLFLSAFHNKQSLTFTIPSFGYSLSTDPSTYVSQDLDGVFGRVFTSVDEPPIIALTYYDASWQLLGLLGTFGDSIDVTVSYDFAASSDSSLLSDLSDTAGAFLSTVGQIADSIVSSPLLLVTVGIFFLGGCVALLGRFLGKD